MMAITAILPTTAPAIIPPTGRELDEGDGVGGGGVVEVTIDWDYFVSDVWFNHSSTVLVVVEEVEVGVYLSAVMGTVYLMLASKPKYRT